MPTLRVYQCSGTYFGFVFGIAMITTALLTTAFRSECNGYVYVLCRGCVNVNNPDICTFIHTSLITRIFDADQQIQDGAFAAGTSQII